MRLSSFRMHLCVMQQRSVFKGFLGTFFILYGKIHLKIYCGLIHTINLSETLFFLLSSFSSSSSRGCDGFATNFIYCYLSTTLHCINLMSIYLSFYMQAAFLFASKLKNVSSDQEFKFSFNYNLYP